jgi:Glycosyl hydrolase catalytic core
MSRFNVPFLGFVLLTLISCKKDITLSENSSEVELPQLRTVTAKKGFGLTESVYGNTQLSALDVSWYYSWGYSTQISSPVASFIPMVFSLNTIPSITPKPVILGFNEPDNVSQSNMSVATAIANWPTLVSNSTLIGSPATADNPLTVNSWLTQFMNWTPKPKVDFVCVHWYKGVSVTQFKNDMNNIIALYNKPIWVTEFAPQTVSSALAQPNKYTQTQVNNFLNNVIPWMEQHPMIQRYAYHNPKYGTCAVFDAAGLLTPTGLTYKNAH